MRRLVVCLAVLALVPVTASAEPAAERYLVGAAVESINPPQSMINEGSFFLGGYGLPTSGRVASRPEAQLPLAGRTAVGILGDGVATRALVVSDGEEAVALAQIDVQGYFVAYRQGPFGLVDIRNHAAAEIAALRAVHGGPAMGAGQILVGSNHTHGGPDTAGVYGGVPTAYLKLVHDRTVKAIVDAWQRLRPADLVYGAVKAGVDVIDDPATDPLTRNQFHGDPANSSTDDEVRVLQATDAVTGETIVTYVNLSAHATMLEESNRHITSDYTGPLSALLAETYGGIGFHQVGTLGRSQPNRKDCDVPGLTGTAYSQCRLDQYARRVAAKVAVALAAATPVATPPVVEMHSYLVSDAMTNGPVFAMGVGGMLVGAPIYRAGPPWSTGNVLASMTFSGRIGDLLISGNPGEAYPQIPLAVRSAVTGDAAVAMRGFLSISTAGDFLGYLIAPLEAYPRPIQETMFDTNDASCGPVGCLHPVENDNYLFNPSYTFGERITCSLLRGAGDVLGRGADAYWSGYDRCLAFASDHVLPADADTGLPESSDLSALYELYEQ